MRVLGKRISLIDIVLFLVAVGSTGWLAKTIGVAVRRPKNSVVVERAREYSLGAFLRNHGARDSLKNRTHLVVFSDFTCTYCRALSDVMPTLERRYRSVLSVSFRHAPMNRLSATAAAAYECAVRYTSYSEREIREKTFQSTRTMLDALRAKNANVDPLAAFDFESEEVRRCISSGELEKLVSDDQAAYRSLKLSGTPVIIAGRTRFSGYPGFTALDSALRDGASTSGLR